MKGDGRTKMEAQFLLDKPVSAILARISLPRPLVRSPSQKMERAVENSLLQNPWFWMGETFQAILAASATVANFAVLLEFSLSKAVLAILPRDIRYLYCNKALCALLISISILIKCMLTFANVPTQMLSYYTKTFGGGHRRVYYFDACQYQIGLALAACISMIMTILGTSIQRLLAAFAIVPSKNVQTVTRKQRLSASLFLAVTWLVALATALGLALIMPPRTSYWHECSAVYILPRSAIIAAVVLVPIVTLMSVLMQVAAWLSTKRGMEEEAMTTETKGTDSNDNPIEKSHRMYTETTLTEMNLPSVLLFAGSWSVITLFLAYERLIPSFNPDSYLFNVYEKTPYYDDNGGFFDEKATPPVNTLILTQFFIYIPLLIEITLDPLCTYWKRPSKSHLVAYSASFLSEISNKDGVKDRLLEKIKDAEAEEDNEKEKEKTARNLTTTEEEKNSELHTAQISVDIDDDDQTAKVH